MFVCFQKCVDFYYKTSNIPFKQLDGQEFRFRLETLNWHCSANTCLLTCASCAVYKQNNDS